MPEPTDPLSRLDRLAPSVDPDAATVAFGTRRASRARRRRAVAGGSIAAVALVLVGIGAALARPGDDGEQVLAGSTTEAPPTVTAPVGLDQDERRTSIGDQGLTLAMDTPLAATVGERMWVEVTLTNGRPDPVEVGAAAACHEPLGALAGDIEAVSAVEADTGFGAFDADAPGGSGQITTVWSGELDELPDALRSGVDPKVYAGRDEALLSTTSTVCVATVPPPETLAPGASITRRIAIDLRWATPASVDGEAIEVLASTGPIESADGADLGKVTVRQPVALRDPVDRQTSYDGALGADGVVAAPTLPEWAAMTEDLGPDVPADFVQQYLTGLTWWNGGWEAWIHPGRGSGHQTDPLRIRYDAERMEVVDVRTVFANSAPSDDPDRPDPDGEVDDIRYQAG